MSKGLINHPFRTPEEIVHVYQTYHNDVIKDRVSFSNNKTSQLAEDFRAFTYLYLELFLVTNVNSWLEKATELADHVLTVTDVKLVEAGLLTLTPADGDSPYRSAPHPYLKEGTPFPGWHSYRGTPDIPTISIIDQGLIIETYSVLANFLLNVVPGRHDAKANLYLDKVEEVIQAFDSSWGEEESMSNGAFTFPGIYWRPDRSNVDNPRSSFIIEWNDQSYFMIALLILDFVRDRPAYRNKVDLFMQTMSKDYNGYGRRLLNGAYVWSYPFLIQDSVSGLQSAIPLFNLLEYAYSFGLDYPTEGDMRRHAHSILSLKRPEAKLGMYAANLDGSGTLSPTAYSYAGYLVGYKTWEPDINEMIRQGISRYLLVREPTHLHSHALFLRLQQK